MGTAAQTRVIMRYLSRQVMVVVSTYIQLPYGTLGEILLPVASQLAVRNHFQNQNLELY